MIAEAMYVSGHGPASFGVEPSAELGAEFFALVFEQKQEPEADPFDQTRQKAEELRRQYG
jgi:hypothetical protein